MSWWRKPFLALKIRLPLPMKSPDEATTFSRWFVLATVMVSMSVYHPPYLRVEINRYPVTLGTVCSYLNVTAILRISLL